MCMQSTIYIFNPKIHYTKIYQVFENTSHWFTMGPLDISFFLIWNLPSSILATLFCFQMAIRLVTLSIWWLPARLQLYFLLAPGNKGGILLRAIIILTFKALTPTLGGPVPGPDRDPASPPLREVCLKNDLCPKKLKINAAPNGEKMCWKLFLDFLKTFFFIYGKKCCSKLPELLRKLVGNDYWILDPLPGKR